MDRVGLACRPLLAVQQQHLVAAVDHRVDALRKHCRRTRERGGDEFCDGYAEVGSERRPDDDVCAPACGLGLHQGQIGNARRKLTPGGHLSSPGKIQSLCNKMTAEKGAEAPSDVPMSRRPLEPVTPCKELTRSGAREKVAHGAAQINRRTFRAPLATAGGTDSGGYGDRIGDFT